MLAKDTKTKAMISRRGLLTGFGAIITAPAIIPVHHLMALPPRRTPIAGPHPSKGFYLPAGQPFHLCSMIGDR